MTTSTLPESKRHDVVTERTLPQRVQAFLEMRACPERRLRVSEHDGTIVLEGNVGFYHERQIALTCAQHVTGVRHVVDRIVVKTRSPHATDLE